MAAQCIMFKCLGLEPDSLGSNPLPTISTYLWHIILPLCVQYSHLYSRTILGIYLLW